MVAAASGLVLSYNGEVYNFVELRRELEARGRTFVGTSDTEVVLAAYEEWGGECLRRFNGMWAFAVWDPRRHELFLARDRFGVKPLFYYSNRERLAFASEIKALLTLDDCPRRPNEAFVRDFLVGYPSIERHERTVFAGIRRLEAGHFMVVRPGAVTTRRWWRTSDEPVEVPTSPQEQVERYRELFDEACRVRLRSDVPVASLLSGGLDSSAIVCTVAAQKGLPGWVGADERLAPDWQRTFTAELPGSSFDESGYARAVLDHVGLEGTFIKLDRPDVVDAIRQNVRRQDAPVPPSLLAVDAVYRGVSENGVKVTLDGQGSDETLSGYQAEDAIAHYLRRAALGEAWAAARCQALGWIPPESAGGVVRRALRAEMRRRLRLRSRLRELAGRGSVPPPPVSGAPSADLMRLPGPSPLHDESRATNEVDRRLYREFHESVLPQILRTFDHAAMAWGVESRMPFLDWRLVTYGFALPVEQKVHGGQVKAVLRQAMADRLPAAVKARRVKFGFPIASEWFDSAETIGQVREVLHSPEFVACTYWDAPAFAGWFEGESERGWGWHAMERLFAVLAVHVWEREYFGAGRPRTAA
jgi:asparagine synthase (glutamine-hydrolysing)